MRTIAKTPAAAVILALSLGASTAAAAPSYEAEILPVQGVAGTVTLDPATSRGDFSVSEGVLEYRSVPVTGSPVTDDPRLIGQLESTWNWDILRAGAQPVPAWGTMLIEVPPIFTADSGLGDDAEDVYSEPPAIARAGSWVGDFTGIRRHDGDPFIVRAFLMGEGAYEGLCAVLDIEAGIDAWTIDGVIHRVPMQG